MGFEVGTRTVHVRLRNTEFDGVEATCRAANVLSYFDALKSDRAHIEGFLEHCESWNLTHDGEPIPISPEAANQIDTSLLLSLAIGWVKGSAKPVKDRPFSDADMERMAAQLAAEQNGAAEPDFDMT